MISTSRTVTWTALVAMVIAGPLLDSRQPDLITQTDGIVVKVRVALWVDDTQIVSSTVASDDNLSATPAVVTPLIISTSASSVTSGTVPVVMNMSTLAAVPSSQPSVQVSSLPVSSMLTTTQIFTASVVPTATDVLSVTTTTNYSQVGRHDTSNAMPSTPAATQSAVVNGDTSSGTNSPSDSNMCTGPSTICVGDITHYDGGLGACGWNVNTATDMQIALPFEFMGTQSNGNPYCGKSLTIKNPTTGHTIQATVGDKCMGCTGRSIDLTDAAFDTVGNGCDGRCSGFEWWFN